MTDREKRIKPPKDSIRVQLYPEDYLQLCRIAADKGCFYKGEGNLGFLLTKIAQGSLKVREIGCNEDVEEKEMSTVPLIGLEVRAASSLNGFIALVTEKIAKFEGNIHDVKARDQEPIIRLTFFMKQEQNLNNLITELRQIKVKDIIDFNPQIKLEKLLEALDPEGGKLYKTLIERSRMQEMDEVELSDKSDEEESQIKHSYNKKNAERILIKTLKNIENKPIITSIELTIGFRVEVKNQPGVLAKLALLLAKKHISILEIDQKLDPKEELNIAILLLGFYPILGSESIKETKDFIANLRKEIPEIENISRLSVSLPK
jgi:predicted amino acid-binding ACT domain protein